MTKFKTLAVLLIMATQYVMGQQKWEPILIGDTVPDFSISNIFNYKSASARLADFKGKVVILDFWSTGCAPCVKALPDMDAIQEKFGDQVQVFAFSYEGVDIVKKIIQKKSLKHAAIVALDTVTQKLFPRKSIPHGVIINQEGKVLAITNSLFITEDIVKDVLENKPISLPFKRDILAFINDSNLPAWATHPMFSGEATFHAAISKRIDGMSGSIYNRILANGNKMFSAFNINAVGLYTMAFEKPISYRYGRVVLENIKDPTLFVQSRTSTNAEKTAWALKNTYSYYQEVPANTSKEATEAYMVQQLNSAFSNMLGITASIGNRKMPCYFLTGKIPARIVVKNDIRYGLYSDGEKDQSLLQSASMADFCGFLEDLTLVAVVDKTGSTEKIDISFPENVLEAYRKNRDISLLNNYLKQFGLKLEPGEAVLEALVVKGI